jgi:hypothetical protein
MSDVEKLLKLNDFENKTFLRLQFEIAGRVLDGLLELELALAGNVQRGEEVGNQTEEHRVVVRHDLGEVEVSQSSHQNLKCI